MSDERDEFDETDTDVFQRADEELEIDSGQNWVELPSANLLNIDRVGVLMRTRRPKVITVIGERNGGKTTLVAELYERFLRGPFSDFHFCQSLSLLGFEQKGFWSRAVSGAQRPDTQRTSALDGLKFFHIALCEGSDGARSDLLISERAGETYRNARDKPENALDLIELRHANIIVLILDGARVAQSRERAEAFASVRTLVQALRDSGAAPSTATLQLVTTKEDLLAGDEQVKAREALLNFEEKFIANFSAAFQKVIALRVAARDPSGRVAVATGLDALLRSWMRPFAPPLLERGPPPALVDEFDRLLLRRGE